MVAKEKSKVTVKIKIPSSIPAFINATVHIYLEDTSYIDKAAEIKIHSIKKNIQHQPLLAPKQDTILTYELLFDCDSRRYYTVRVWIDRDGNGEQDSNDLYSSDAIPVLTHGFGATAVISFN